MKPKILVIDDDSLVLNAFQMYLRKIMSEKDLTLCLSFDEAIQEFRKNPQSYACAFIDYRLKNEFGEEERIGHKLAQKLKELNPRLYMVMMSGDDSKEALNHWLSSGIEKFLYKPLQEELIHAFIEQSLAIYEESHHHLQDKVVNYHGLIGVSENTRKVVNLTKKFAPTDESVLITGETGTGKEIIARAIHKDSKRSRGPFVALNCAAISEGLFESILFGHVKGAFTGAGSHQLGKFREADGGTLFLDEIHQLNEAHQAKLLRAVQEKSVMPVGGQKEINVDFRLVCASKPHLRESSMDNEFLPDLFFRISSLNIDVLPLRSRVDDILPLVSFFQQSMEEKFGTHKVISPTALKKLQIYSWPGNVRELQKIMGELYFVVDHSHIKPSDLPKSILESTPSFGMDGLTTMDDLKEQQVSQKVHLIKSTMKKVGNNKTMAAKILGMNRSTFVWTMKELGIYSLFEESAPFKAIRQRIKNQKRRSKEEGGQTSIKKSKEDKKSTNDINLNYS